MGNTELLADKKRAIFESTLELVQEHGFHGTPMSLVAKRAGVAAGTIYHYFESKEQLICELFLYIRNQLTAVILKEDCENEPYRDCFFNLWNGLYTYYKANPNVFRFFEQYTNSPFNKKERALKADDFHHSLFQFMERGVTEGHLRVASPKILGILLHSSIISHLKVQAFHHLKLAGEELNQIQLIPEILWEGMKKS